MTGAIEQGLVPVTAAPFADPGRGRIDFTVPAGATSAEIVDLALPGATENQLDRARVVLTTPKGQWPIPRSAWGKVRPRDGVNVVIRLVPGKDAFRSILTIVVSIAAAAIGQVWLGPLL